MIAAGTYYFEVGYYFCVGEGRSEVDSEGETHLGGDYSPIWGKTEELLVELALFSAAFNMELGGYF